MGGYGSGRRLMYLKKEIVEDCLVLRVTDLAHVTTIGPDADSYVYLVWRNSVTKRKLARIGFELRTNDNAGSAWLHYVVGTGQEAEGIDYEVRLVTTRPHFGGLRWWFRCPLSVNGRPCGRRVGVLYLPPRGKLFGCRHCHDLTYRSCQESHKYDRLYAELAAMVSDEIPGATADEVKSALRGLRGLC